MDAALNHSLHHPTQLVGTTRLLRLLASKLQDTLYHEPPPNIPHAHWHDSWMLVQAKDLVENY